MGQTEYTRRAAAAVARDSRGAHATSSIRGATAVVVKESASVEASVGFAGVGEDSDEFPLGDETKQALVKVALDTLGSPSKSVVSIAIDTETGEHSTFMSAPSDGGLLDHYDIAARDLISSRFISSVKNFVFADRGSDAEDEDGNTGPVGVGTCGCARAEKGGRADSADETVAAGAVSDIRSGSRKGVEYEGGKTADASDAADTFDTAHAGPGGAGEDALSESAFRASDSHTAAELAAILAAQSAQRDVATAGIEDLRSFVFMHTTEPGDKPTGAICTGGFTGTFDPSDETAQAMRAIVSAVGLDGGDAMLVQVSGDVTTGEVDCHVESLGGGEGDENVAASCRASVEVGVTFPGDKKPQRALHRHELGGTGDTALPAEAFVHGPRRDANPDEGDGDQSDVLTGDRGDTGRQSVLGSGEDWLGGLLDALSEAIAQRAGKDFERVVKGPHAAVALIDFDDGSVHSCSILGGGRFFDYDVAAGEIIFDIVGRTVVGATGKKATGKRVAHFYNDGDGGRSLNTFVPGAGYDFGLDVQRCARVVAEDASSSGGEDTPQWSLTQFLYDRVVQVEILEALETPTGSVVAAVSGGSVSKVEVFANHEDGRVIRLPDATDEVALDMGRLTAEHGAGKSPVAKIGIGLDVIDGSSVVCIFRQGSGEGLSLEDTHRVVSAMLEKVTKDTDASAVEVSESDIDSVL